MDGDGNLLWHKHSNGSENESILASTIDPENNLYFAGQLRDTVDFDFCTTSEQEFGSPIAGSVVYNLKLSQCKVFGETITTVDCSNYTSPYEEVYTETGIYFEIFDGSCNCDSLITFDVTINSIDNGISQEGAELNSNEANREATYQWVNCETDYTEIPGETDQVYTATENGGYGVIVAIGACVDTSDCFLLDNIGIETNTSKMDVNIYPNPSNGSFNIQFGQTYQTVNVIICNVTGEIIMKSAHNSVATIPMEIEQAQGLYFIEIKTDNSEQVFLKLVCE